MTRQEAIEILNNKAFTFCNFERCVDFYTALNCGKCNDALSMAIKALQQEPKWIPVTERLPEEGLTVLILAENGHIEFGQRDENKWEWLAESIADYWTEAEEVIAWQPLPKPYKESEENGND